MAIERIKLNSLGLLEESPIEHMQIGDVVVTVHKFIPYEEMLNMIQWCIDYIINDRPFISAPLKKIIKDFAVLNFYTNFDFSFLTEYGTMAEIYAEYDLVVRYNVMPRVLSFVDKDQMVFFNETLDATLDSIMAYRNSAKGIVDALADSAQSDINKMQGAIDLLKDEEQASKLQKMIEFAEEIQGPAK